MSFFKILIWVLLVGPVAFPLEAFAQNTPPPKLRFLFLDETAGAYSLKLGSDFRRLSAAPYVISAAYTPPDFQRLEIYKALPEPDPETGRPVRIQIAALIPPSGASSALVILTPRAPAGEPGESAAYSIEIIDNNPTTFPAGAIRILNRGQTTLAARLAGEQIQAEPGSSKIITPAIADSRGRLRILVAVQNSTEWKLIDDNVAVVKPDTRLTGLLVYSPSGMKFRLGPYIIAERGSPPPSHVWLTYTDTP